MMTAVNSTLNQRRAGARFSSHGRWADDSAALRNPNDSGRITAHANYYPMGSKKNKVKKILASSSTPPNPNNSAIDDDLVDDLFAELDSRDKTVPQQEPASASAQAAAAAVLDKMSSKSRFMARQVRVSRRDPFRAGNTKCLSQGKESSRAR